MKHSDSNHLRRLLAWVSCEIGQTPEELVATMQSIAVRLEPVDIADASRQRLVEAHDKARAVPAYVHAALKALRKATNTMGDVVESDVALKPTPTVKELTEIISGHLTSVYVCGRVWDASGTMSQDDFTEAGETDFPGDLATAIHAHLMGATKGIAQ